MIVYYNTDGNDSLFITFGFACFIILCAILCIHDIIINDGIIDEQAHQNDEELRRKHREHQSRQRANEQAWCNSEEEHAGRYNTVSEEIQKSFDVFELQYSANFYDVKKKYRKMISLFHPDKHYSCDDSVMEYANKKTKELNDAFNTLKVKHFNAS